jgi:hypothetical protein
VWVLLPKVILYLLGAVILLQMGIFLDTDFGIYSSYIRREQTSQSIAFYRKLERDVLPMLQEQNLVVYRDWHIYFPENEGHRIEMSWEPASYTYIEELNPDLNVLEGENMKTFSRQDLIDEAVEPGEMTLVSEFYRDALTGQLDGFKLVAKSDFAYAFLRDELYRQYFPTN